LEYLASAIRYVGGFVVLLGVLIFVHEFGHFIVAKIAGIKVLKFSLGFPPALFKRQWGETEYVLSWIPLGGYVKLLGEDPESDEEIPPEDLPRAFTSKPLLARVAVIVAGPLFNYLFAVFLLSAAYLAGVPVVTSEVGQVVEGTPALAAGLKPGDKVVAIDDHPIWRWVDMRSIIQKSGGKQISLTVERDDKVIHLSVTPVVGDQKGPFGEPVGQIGVVPSDKGVRLGFLASIQEGGSDALYLTKMVVVTLVKLVTREISTDTLRGPLTIAQAAGASLKIGWFLYIHLLCLISINLAIINLLPIPILDGGHLLF
jgi:regulator of sigma E protease